MIIWQEKKKGGNKKQEHLAKYTFRIFQKTKKRKQDRRKRNKQNKKLKGINVKETYYKEKE